MADNYLSDLRRSVFPTGIYSGDMVRFDGNEWVRVDAAEFYFAVDLTASLSAGTAWVTITGGTLPIATKLPTDGQARTIDVELWITDDGGERDVVRIQGSIRRSGTSAVLCNLDDGTTGTTVGWTVTLITAAEAIELQLTVSGTDVLIQARQVAVGGRTVSGSYWLGVVK